MKAAPITSERNAQSRPRVDITVGLCDPNALYPSAAPTILSHYFLFAAWLAAAQNLVKGGTYPLPEAQMDRFALQFKFGYVQPHEEVAILSAQQNNHPLIELVPVRDPARSAGAQARDAKSIRISDELKRYIVDIVGATRTAAGRATRREPARVARVDEGGAGAGVV